MHPTFLAIALLSSSPPVPSTVAALHVDGDQSSFMVKVTEDASVGYRITIDCIEQCKRAIHYLDTSGDAPLGIFSRDQRGLVFSLWSGGSAYRVVVWSVLDDGVQKVAELSSRGRPDFMTGPDGAPTIQTYEAEGVTTLQHRVRWTFTHGHFVRQSSKGS